ncbi:MAG: hypothetical protein D6788_01050, partial [Planctomycetota bacterium]
MPKRRPIPLRIARPHAAGVLFVFGLAVVAAASPPQFLSDPAGDAVARPTDPGAVAPFDPQAHRLPDLVEIRLGAFEPDAPTLDPFTGQFLLDDSDADLFRLDLVLSGVMNPPGRADAEAFHPFVFGPNPVYGFVELDMDDDVNTGGETSATRFRYNANIARFGGVPDDDRFRDRVALDASDLDGNVLTPPFVDRSGEEFHLALLGTEFESATIEVISGDGDGQFEAGETWWIHGRFFHRAHGFEPFSFASGGRRPGEYAPIVTLQFMHDPISDRTTISLVFPLTQFGAALLTGGFPEPSDGDSSNQASVFEALEELQLSAAFIKQFPTGKPEEVLILGWSDKDPDSFLEPSDWVLTALLGSSYTIPNPQALYYVWSEAYPDVVRGDVTGDGEAGGDDRDRIVAFVNLHDGDDGVIDGVVPLPGFAENFSVFDISYDGRVDDLDVLLLRNVPSDDYLKRPWAATAATE